MIDDTRRTDSASELVEIIHEVRRRWRMKLALRGAMGVAGLGVLVLLVSAYGLESWRFTAASIIAFRVIVGVALVGFASFSLMPPRLLSETPERYGPPAGSHPPASFEDTLAKYPTFWSFKSDTVNTISNQFAAMPSVHCAWALWCAAGSRPS